MAGRWTPARIRHALSTIRYGRNPAATVYDSLGTDFPLALAPGWLNLGLWEGDGADPAEAPAAVRRLVERGGGPPPPPPPPRGPATCWTSATAWGSRTP